jgi:hypothetical protein
MAGNEVYYPEQIDDQELPIAGSIAIPALSQGANTYGQDTQKPQGEKELPLPERFIAHEVMSKTLDTQNKKIRGEYTFGKLGAIRIGEFKSGVSGELVITPDGITAKNVNGQTTVTIDGTTGNATFMGTIQAGTLIAGATQVGGASVTLDGANGRIVIHDGTVPRGVFGNA